MRFLMSIIFVALSASVAQAVELNLKLEGFRNGVGFVALSIFEESQKQAFPGQADKAAKTFYLPLDGKQELHVTVDDLPEGTYAIALLHDEDGDRKLKTALGIPREGFGFSNNPGVMVGAPGFSKCAFKLGAENVQLTIRAKYIL